MLLTEYIKNPFAGDRLSWLLSTNWKLITGGGGSLSYHAEENNPRIKVNLDT